MTLLSSDHRLRTFVLALHHASLYDRIRRSEQKCKVALEVLSYHASCTDEEYERTKTLTVPENIPHIERFEYSPWDVANEMKPVYVLYMFLDLAKMNPSNANRSVVQRRSTHDGIVVSFLDLTPNA